MTQHSALARSQIILIDNDHALKTIYNHALETIYKYLLIHTIATTKNRIVRNVPTYSY